VAANVLINKFSESYLIRKAISLSMDLK